MQYFLIFGEGWFHDQNLMISITLEKIFRIVPINRIIAALLRYIPSFQTWRPVPQRLAPGRGFQRGRFLRRPPTVSVAAHHS